MARYILKRLLILVPVLLGVSLLIFFILTLMPAEVAAIQLGIDVTEEAVERWNEEHGLNDPFFVRYFKYMKGLLQGDLGNSWKTKTSINKEFVERIPSTLILTFGSLAVSVIVGVTVGVISAIRQYSIFDYSAIVGAMIITSVPAFWLGLLLVLFFSLRLGLLPATGGSTLKSYILPWITLSAATSAQLIRMTRSTMLEVIRSDYVLTAKAKGASPFRVILKHELRNALLPTITVIGIILGGALGGALVTETVFALPGVGTYLLHGVLSYDMPVVMISVLFIAAVIGLINLVVDVLYMYIDPRLRSQFIKGYSAR